MTDILYKLRNLALKSKKKSQKKAKNDSGTVLYSDILDSENEPSFEHSDIKLRREALFGNLTMPKCNFTMLDTEESEILLDTDRLKNDF